MFHFLKCKLYLVKLSSIKGGKTDKNSVLELSLCTVKQKVSSLFLACLTSGTADVS